MSLQPASTQLASRTTAVIDGLKHLEGPLLPILHGIQEEFGYVPTETLPIIAEALKSVARRGLRRVHLLPRFPQASGRPPRAQGLPRRSLPVDGRRPDRGADRAAPRHRLPRHRQGRLGDAGAGLLPRAVRLSPSAMLDGEVIGRLDADKIEEIAARGPSMSLTVYVPCNSGALALGAERVAQALAREAAARGADVDDRPERLARALLAGADGRGDHRPRAAWPMARSRPPTSAGLLDAGLLDGGEHP